MKKLFLILLIFSLFAGIGFAQVPDFSLADMKTGFQGFIDAVANALPMASTVGLQWSDAYIGQLPKFGVGLSAGAVLIPIETLTPVFTPLGLDIPDLPIPQELAKFVGFPFPAWAFDARLGGLILPFDIGFKAGFIPQVVRDQLGFILPPGLSYDYLLLGGDIRIPIIKKTKGAFRPNLSIGGGYTYYKGSFTFTLPPVAAPISFSVPDPIDPDNPPAELTYTDYTYSLTDPKVNLFWDAHVIDLKAQFSLKFLWLLTPYIGVGGSYARATAGGGFLTRLLDGNGNEVTENDPTLMMIQDYLATIGEELPLSSLGGFNVQSYVNGWSFRAFGGLSVNIWVLKVDASIMYNFLDGSLGATAGIRLQL